MTARVVTALRLSLGMAVTTALLLTPAAHGAVLCAKARKDGTVGGTLRIREACAKREVEVDPAALGLCCEGPTTTMTVPSTTVTVTSTNVCPTYTTSTLGIPDCGESFCFGLCPNALACVADDEGLCSCAGPEVACQVVSAGGTCGGTCPEGLACQTVQPVGEDGCPGAPRCGCAPDF